MLKYDSLQDACEMSSREHFQHTSPSSRSDPEWKPDVLLAYLIDKSYVPFVIKLQNTRSWLGDGEVKY